MKPLSSLLIIFLCLFVFGFKPYTTPVYITGHIKNNSKTLGVNAFISVFVKNGNRVIAKTTTNENGDFTLTFTPRKKSPFDFYCYSPFVETLLLESVDIFDNDTPDMTFYLPCEPKKDSLGKIICPKCHKADKVYPIEYGAPVYVRNANKHDNPSNKKISLGKYEAGTCTVSAARYYCDRDNIKF